MDKGEDMVGCCFYTLQALFDMFENESNQLLLSYGNFHDTPDAVEVGNCICTQLKEAGFEVIWNKDVNTKLQFALNGIINILNQNDYQNLYDFVNGC